jgi:glycosyltransferase involved in cell wall biosynthesis
MPDFAPVSVVVPCYRCADTIERALLSVFTQSWKPAEVILVDDFSGDDTLAKLYALRDDYPSGWVNVFALKENCGPGSARNKGWENSSQPYIAFLDSDDSWHPKKIEIQLGWMLRRPDVALTGHAYRIGCQSQVNEVPDLDIEGIYFNKIGHRKMLLSNKFSTPTVILKQELLNRFVPKKRYSEDYLLWCEICLDRNECYWSNAPLVNLYKAAYGAAGLSSELWAMERGELDCYSRLHSSGRIRYSLLLLLFTISMVKYLKRLFVVNIRKFKVER